MLVLRIGHKYAISDDIHTSLNEMVEETFTQFKKKFDKLTVIEQINWRRWKTRMLDHIKSMPRRGNPRIIAHLHQGVKDLRALNVVLKQSDKNLGLVAIRGDIYNALVREHLLSDTYKLVQEFPHKQIWTRLQNITKLITPEISLKEKKSWLSDAIGYKDPCPFYVIPKIHKPVLSSRPITAQHSYMLAPISKALAAILQPICDCVDEIAKDSKQVVQQLETTIVPEDCTFLTYDVEKLYPSIDLKDAIEILTHNLGVMRQNRGFWKKILQLIMYNNYVIWNDKVYRQMAGTATGTQVAPPFANLYLYFKFKSIFEEEANDIIFQSRYLDDGLILTRDTRTAERIIEKLNQCSNLKLTHEISDQGGTYLDLDVYKGHRYNTQKLVDIKTHFKNTNKFLYLPALSNHPGAHKTGVVKGEAIRCLRNTSDKTNWLCGLRLIFNGLKARGYNPSIIKRKWKEVRFEDREKYIFHHSTATPPPGETIFVRYHAESKTKWKRLLKKEPIQRLFVTGRHGQLSATQKALLEAWPPTPVFKNFKKIGNLLIDAKEVWKLNRTYDSITSPNTVTPAHDASGPSTAPRILRKRTFAEMATADDGCI